MIVCRKHDDDDDEEVDDNDDENRILDAHFYHLFILLIHS